MLFKNRVKQKDGRAYPQAILNRGEAYTADREAFSLMENEVADRGNHLVIKAISTASVPPEHPNAVCRCHAQSVEYILDKLHKLFHLLISNN